MYGLSGLGKGCTVEVSPKSVRVGLMNENFGNVAENKLVLVSVLSS